MGRFHQHDDGSWHDHEVSGDGSPGAHSHDAGDHSQYETGRERIQLLERVFGENDRMAAENRNDLQREGVIAINLMSAPGAGLDADRLRNLGATIELINTGDGFGGECHLDAPMVRSALVRLPLARLDLILIENVGNLVCPAEFDVGEHARAMIHAVTEGEDKPLKYPIMFRSADLVIINKIDLLPHLDVDLDAFRRNLRAVNPTATTIEVSARTGVGVAAWCAWIESLRRPAPETIAT